MFLSLQTKRDRRIAGVIVALSLAAAIFLRQASLPVVETGSWGLSFRQDGQTPTGTASQAVLDEFGAAYIGDTTEPVIYLTFDAGYENGYTAQILDTLAAHDVHAAFFLVGNYLEKEPELVRRMVSEGHTVGNHTYHHVQMPREGALICGTELDMTNQLIREITGETPEIMRPPFGQWSRSLEEQIEMIPVSWDVDPLDWETPDAGIVANRILSDVENGDIILLHDSYATSVEAALRVIDVLQAEGMEFVAAEDLLFD